MKPILSQLLIVFVILFIFYFIHSYLERYKETYENKERKWVILLTTCISPSVYRINEEEKSIETEKRKKIYETQIRKWLDNTSYPIYVVESSGYDFPDIEKKDNRLKIFTHTISTSLPSSSQCEARSILYALENMNDVDDEDYILKVTGRYFLPNIENSLKNTSKDKDIFLQIHRNIKEKSQNSEYFGMKKKDMKDFSECVKDIGLMEKKLFTYTNDKRFETLGPFDNDVSRGGDKLIIQKL
jgi:hypothetical protein